MRNFPLQVIHFARIKQTKNKYLYLLKNDNVQIRLQEFIQVTTASQTIHGTTSTIRIQIQLRISHTLVEIGKLQQITGLQSFSRHLQVAGRAINQHTLARISSMTQLRCCITYPAGAGAAATFAAKNEKTLQQSLAMKTCTPMHTRLLYLWLFLD